MLRSTSLVALLTLALGPLLFGQDGGITDQRSLLDAARDLEALEVVGENKIIQVVTSPDLAPPRDREGIKARPRLVAIQPGADGPLLRFAVGPTKSFLAKPELFRLPAPDRLDRVLTKLAQSWKKESTPTLRLIPLIGWVLEDGTTSLDFRGREWRQERAESSLRIEELMAAATKAKARVKKAKLSPLAQKAALHILDQVHLSAAPSEDEHVTPILARRLVQNGVLQRALGESAGDVLADLNLQLDRATAPRGLERWVHGGDPVTATTLTFDEDGFGARGLTLREGPRVVSRLHPMPRPSFAPASFELSTQLFFAENGKVSSAYVWADHRVLGSWSLSQNLKADRELWRRIIPEDNANSFTRVAANFLPPHLVALDPNGGVLFLATETGTVRPPKNGSSAERDRFLKRAAEALPDVAHLDLVGQYFFAYVHDSPDPTLPWLVGHEGAVGEIHQSVEQTFATSTAGVCRGDCDDLAEVYQALTRAQGKISHIMAVPGHNALAWADQDPETERWTVRVLHTGPPLEFRSRRLERALSYAYKHFGVFENFDPDQCLVAVRFSGENTRSTWALGWRIFRDADYAETMIDIQRDWHFHTFSRGIAKMESLIANGDDDVANYREMAGLNERIGQYDVAVDWMKRAMEKSKDDRLTLMSRMAANLYAAEKKEEAAKIVAQAAKRLDKMGDRRGATRVALAFEIAQLAFAADEAAPFLPIVEKHLSSSVGSQILGLAQLLDDGRIDDETWRREPQIGEIRRIARNYAGLGVQLIQSADEATRRDSATLARIASQTEVWISVLAFRDPDTESMGPAPVFAQIGQLARASLGAKRFDALLDAVELPPAGAKPRLKGRAASQLQLAEDLPWIKASPAYWSALIAQLFRRNAKVLDRGELKRLRARYDEAVAADRYPEIRSTQLSDAILGRTAFLLALIDGNEIGIRQHLDYVAKQNDKNLRDDTAGLLAATAKFLPDATWTKTLGLWDEIIAKKATYFAIAWDTMSSGAPQRALEAGRLAAKRFADDPAFQEELKLLEAQVAKSTRGSAQ